MNKFCEAKYYCIREENTLLGAHAESKFLKGSVQKIGRGEIYTIYFVYCLDSMGYKRNSADPRKILIHRLPVSHLCMFFHVSIYAISSVHVFPCIHLCIFIMFLIRAYFSMHPSSIYIFLPSDVKCEYFWQSE